MKNRIYIQDWLKFKPYNNHSITDNYYLKLSNDIKNTMINRPEFLNIQSNLKEEEVNNLFCFLVSYFEDIISDTKLWSSFVSIHKRLYKKELPFFELDDYYEDEINNQDIRFLIWYFINTTQKDKFILPFNSFITDVADIIYDIFDNAWDDSPVNSHLKTFYQIDSSVYDYYDARKLMDIVLFQSYLFYFDTSAEIRETETEIIQKGNNKEHLLSILRENRDTNLHNLHSRLLALNSKEWTSAIIKDNKSLSDDILNISQRISGYFFYKGQDNKDIFLEHIASSKKFNITKKSFDYSANLTEEDSIMFMGIARWKYEWWFSGVQFNQDFNADLILDEKNSIESRMSVNFLDHQTEDMYELLKSQQEAFLEFNNNQEIAFIQSNKIDEFLKNFTSYYNSTLKLSKKEIEESKKRRINDGFFGSDSEMTDFSEEEEFSIVFFNPKSGCEIVYGINSAFPLPHNPTFKTEESENHLMYLFMDETISKELVMFCIEKCKSKLPYLNSLIGSLLLIDIDFLLRFWKKEKYHSKPSISFIGQKNH